MIFLPDVTMRDVCSSR